MLAPKPPSDPSKLSPLCRIFEGRTSKILLDFAAILGTHETCRVSGSIWKTSSEFSHGPEIYNCIILKVLTFTYPVSQIIMHSNVLYFGKERNWKSSKQLSVSFNFGNFVFSYFGHLFRILIIFCLFTFLKVRILQGRTGNRNLT